MAPGAGDLYGWEILKEVSPSAAYTHKTHQTEFYENFFCTNLYKMQGITILNTRRNKNRECSCHLGAGSGLNFESFTFSR